MVNQWVEHVKKYAAAHNVKYAVALTDPACKNAYHKSKKNSKGSQSKEGGLLKLGKAAKGLKKIIVD